MKRFIWNTYLDSLDKKYSLFYINRTYKDTSFKNNDDYIDIQMKLSKEIDTLNLEIKKSIQEVIIETYPDVEVILYDSRFFSRNDQMIGRILTKGIKSQSETLDVRACFEKLTMTNIIVDRFEDLSEEDQSEVLKNMKEMKENGQI